jgi:hypothetical protein
MAARDILRSQRPLSLLTDMSIGSNRRSALGVSLGDAERHYRNTLRASYGVLCLVEQLERYGRLPAGVQFEPSGAGVQDRRGWRAWPAAHAVPCDIKITRPNGATEMISELMGSEVIRYHLAYNVFGATDVVPRLVNETDRRCDWPPAGVAPQDAAYRAHVLVEGCRRIASTTENARRCFESYLMPQFVEAANRVGWEAAQQGRALADEQLEQGNMGPDRIIRQGEGSWLVDHLGRPTVGVPERLRLSADRAEPDERVAALYVIVEIAQIYADTRPTQIDMARVESGMRDLPKLDDGLTR